MHLLSNFILPGAFLHSNISIYSKIAIQLIFKSVLPRLTLQKRLCEFPRRLSNLGLPTRVHRYRKIIPLSDSIRSTPDAQKWGLAPLVLYKSGSMADITYQSASMAYTIYKDG